MSLHDVARPYLRAMLQRYGICDGNTCPMLWFSSIITKILEMVESRCGNEAGGDTVDAAAGRTEPDPTKTGLSVSPTDMLAKVRVRAHGSARRAFAVGRSTHRRPIDRWESSARISAVPPHRRSRSHMGRTAWSRDPRVSDGTTMEMALWRPDFTRNIERRFQGLFELGTRLPSELLVDPREVPFHRLLAHEQFLCDLGIQQSLCSECRHPSFGGSERVGAHESHAARPRSGGAQLPG